MEQRFNQALSNQQVIHGAIKAAGIYHHRDDYQDFVQEGIITYAKVYQKYVNQYELTKLNQLAFQKIKWRVIDELRKQMRQSIEVFISDENWQIMTVESKQDFDDFINQFNFTGQEKWLLKQFLENGYSMKELAKTHQLSTKYFQRLKQELKRQMISL